MMIDYYHPDGGVGDVDVKKFVKCADFFWSIFKGFCVNIIHKHNDNDDDDYDNDNGV